MLKTEDPKDTAQSWDIFTRSNLTDLQFLYWVGQKLRPDSPLFNNILAFTLTGSVKPLTFITAFERVVLTSDALRTVITDSQQTPERIVLSHAPAPMTFVDFSAVDDPAQAAQSWMESHSRQPMDMSQCLYETALLKLDSVRFIWYFNQHHLITDATSIFLIFEHVTAVYDQLLQQNNPPALTLPQFEPYVAAKKKSKTAPRAQKAVAYWEEKLAGITALSANGRLTSNSTTRHTVQLTPAQTEQFHQLATAKEFAAATPDLSHFNLLAALLFAHLYRETGQRRLGFVTTIHDRPTKPRRQTIGVLMELCPLTAFIHPGDSFTNLAQQAAADMKQVLIHYRYGATAVLREHVMEIMLNFNLRPALTFQGQPVSQAIIHPGCGSEKFALHVHYFEETNSYELYFDFNNAVYAPSNQKRLIADFMELFSAVLADPYFVIEPLSHNASENDKPALISVNGRPPHTSPRTFTESQILTVWQKILGRDDIGIHDDFFALGGDSLRAMDLFVELEAKTGRHLPMSTLLSAGTIAEMAQAIAADHPDIPAIVTIQKGDSEKRPFFFIPGAAGNTLVVDRITRHLSPSQPVYSFNMPGLVAGQTPLTSVEAIAAFYREGIQAIQPNGPYLLGGYSAGSVIALEIAQQLRVHNQAVDLLINVDMSIESPRLHPIRNVLQRIGKKLNHDPEKQQVLYLSYRDWLVKTRFFFRFIIPKIISRWVGRWHAFWRLSSEQRRQLLLSLIKLAEFERPSGTNPPDIPMANGDMDGDMLTDPRVRHVYDVTDKAVRFYLPRPYHGRVTLIRCPRGYGRADLRSPFPHFGWEKVASEVVLTVIPAKGHLAIVQEPHVQTLGQTIQTHIDQVQLPTQSKLESHT